MSDERTAAGTTPSAIYVEFRAAQLGGCMHGFAHEVEQTGARRRGQITGGHPPSPPTHRPVL